MSASDVPSSISRRAFLSAFGSGAAALALAGCTSVPRDGIAERPQQLITPVVLGTPREMYAARVDDGHQIPAVPIEKIDPRYLRQEIQDPTGERPGTIVVDTSSHFLYLVGYGGRAMRYGVGLGRDGFAWAGRAQVRRQGKWPKSCPPGWSIPRQAYLEEYRFSYQTVTVPWVGLIAGCIRDPLGVRAFCLY